MHSIWPKCVRSPRVNKYNNLATLFRLFMPVSTSLLAVQYRNLGAHIPNCVVSTLFPETSSNCGALLLNYGSLVGDGFRCAHISDKLLYCWFATVSKICSPITRAASSYMSSS